MGIFSNWSWKAAANAVKEFIIALGRGDLVLRMRIDRAFPYILWTFFLGCLSIWWSYMTEQTMLKVEKNSISPIAVTISGFSIGRLFTWVTTSLTTLFDLLRPMEATVPTTVETAVAITAISTE